MDNVRSKKVNSSLKIKVILVESEVIVMKVCLFVFVTARSAVCL